MAPPIDYLHRLPLELWVASWILCSRRQLRRLSLVCRRFRSVCVPLLLEYQCADVGALRKGIRPNIWLERVRHIHRMAVRLDKLAEAPHVLMVKSWKITSASSLPRKRALPGLPSTEVAVSRADVFDGLRDRVITTFFANLALYRNLISLEMSGVLVDASAKKFLLSLPRLQELTLDSCHITHSDEVELKVQRFTICGQGPWFDPAIRRSLKIVSPGRLVQLNLHATREMLPMIIGFDRTPLPCLVNLSLDDASDLDLVLGFLKQCPQLESFVLKSVPATSVASARGHLDSAAVPLLRKLTTPGKVVGFFTPNRPISTVTVLSEGLRDDTISAEDLKQVFMAVLRSSVPLQSISIPRTSSTLDTSAAITAMFPELHFLSMAVPDEDIHIDHSQGFRRRCCLGVFGGGPYFSEDASTLELDDEAAFDDPPVEQISDSEDEPPRRVSPYGLVEHTSPKYQEFVHRICTRSISFPPNLETLRLRMPWQMGIFYADQHDQLVAALNDQYPLLREITMEWASWEWIWKISGSREVICTGNGK